MARQETAWLTLWETPCTSKNQSRLWQFVPCSRSADEDTRLPQRTAQIIWRKIVSKKTVRVLGQNSRSSFTAERPKMKGVSPSIVGRN